MMITDHGFESFLGVLILLIVIMLAAPKNLLVLKVSTVKYNEEKPEK